MRDLLNDLSEGLSHPDPIRRAQINMKRPLPKRFYQTVSTRPGTDGIRIELDGREIKTPARRTLAVPTESLALLIAQEWEAQAEVIDPATMPVTRLVNTALDGIADDSRAVLAEIVQFSTSDLLCYRAEAPEQLVQRQADAWDPILSWLAEKHHARFILIEGVMPQEQPAEAVAAFAHAMEQYAAPLDLAALHTVTTLTGSAFLALAFAEGTRSPDEVWSLAHVDEDWTNEHWGRDEEAEARRAARFDEFLAATRLFAASRP